MLVRALGAYGFDGPDGLTLNGDDLFVMNTWGSITELDASSGALVRVMTNPPYDLSRPQDSVVDYGNLFVTSWNEDPPPDNTWVTEINAPTGARAAVTQGLSWATSMVAIGSRVFVATLNGTAGNDNSITEIDAQSGTVVKTLPCSPYGLGDLVVMGSDGDNLLVTNGSPGKAAVVELNATTGSLVWAR